MDWPTLVTGGVEAISDVARQLNSRGIPVVGIYLLNWTSPDGDDRWTLRMVSTENSDELNLRMITQVVALRRDGALPYIDSAVSFDIVSEDDPEASRIMDYVQRLGGAPQIIRSAMWHGLFIEFAVVAMVPERAVAAA